MLSGFSSYFFGSSQGATLSLDDLSTLRINTRPSDDLEDWLLVDRHTQSRQRSVSRSSSNQSMMHLSLLYDNSLLSRSSSVQSLNLSLLYDVEGESPLTSTLFLNNNSPVRIDTPKASHSVKQLKGSRKAYSASGAGGAATATTSKRSRDLELRRYRELACPQNRGKGSSGQRLHVRAVGYNNNRRCRGNHAY